ncbi:MAG: TROVE domain-containing protein [Anaerolineae bacterium]|nr:TROVE domain-containing protein [Anaerolineae bacterium]
MTKLRQLFSLKETPQNRPIPNSGQVANDAGGFAWAVDDWVRLDRFLVLGSEGGTFYVKPQKLTVDNAEAIMRCIEADGLRVVERIVEISTSGRAPKNDPALFALALAAAVGDDVTRRAALDALPQVARIGTHLFHFLDFVEGFRGWGRGLRRGIGNWYNVMPTGRLAYQAVKYQQRDGWSHRDALRLAHPVAATPQHDAIFNWITQGWDGVGEQPHPDEALQLIWAFERAKRADNVADVIDLAVDYRLPWEAIPTQWLKQPDVWQALLPTMPMTAMMRNLARMTANGALKPLSEQVDLVVDRLADKNRLRKARVHPIAVLAALTTYANGRGVRGKLTWDPIAPIIDALDKAFYLTFDNVEPTGKRLVLALDVSGSMTWGQVAGVPGLTPRNASAAMALVTAATERKVAFTGFAGELVRLKISARMRLDQVVENISGIPFGRTDAALPMLWALENKVKADTFVIYTDSETWYGKVHPVQALRAYRRKMGIPAKLIVVGMTSNGFSIADPNDAGMLDVVGFDASAPALMADFIRD